MSPQAGPALGAGHMDPPARLSPLILSSKPWVQCRDLGLYSNSSSAAQGCEAQDSLPQSWGGHSCLGGWVRPGQPHRDRRGANGCMSCGSPP